MLRRGGAWPATWLPTTQRPAALTAARTTALTTGDVAARKLLPQVVHSGHQALQSCCWLETAADHAAAFFPPSCMMAPARLLTYVTRTQAGIAVAHNAQHLGGKGRVGHLFLDVVEVAGGQVDLQGMGPRHTWEEISVCAKGHNRHGAETRCAAGTCLPPITNHL